MFFKRAQGLLPQMRQPFRRNSLRDPVSTVITAGIVAAEKNKNHVNSPGRKSAQRLPLKSKSLSSQTVVQQPDRLPRQRGIDAMDISRRAPVEPEGEHTNEMYVGGLSSSLPEDVQLAMYRTVPGLENCKIVRNAYAIEYDCIKPNQLYPSLEFKEIKGLFSGGQFNGSSGYEEAAAQGLIAGINAAQEILGKEPLVLDRSEAYIGVLIDDLVTKDNFEPYRMMTSRAEYRLLLRQDNADLRLRKKGYDVGLITQEQYDYICEKERLIEEETNRVKSTKVGASKDIQKFLEEHDSATLKTAASIAELICRPELTYEMLAEIDPERKPLPADVIEQVNINVKYEGYIERQMRQVKQYKKMETKKIPENINYDDIDSLRLEARQKLIKFKTVSVGQASRISGVSPADISVLLVFLEHYRNTK